MRDEQLVNLPCGLLVRDDVIYLRPGQVTPAMCRRLRQVYTTMRTHPGYL